MRVECSPTKVSIRLTNEEHSLLLKLCNDVKSILDTPLEENLVYQQRLLINPYGDSDNQANFDLNYSLDRHNEVSSNLTMFYHALTSAEAIDKKIKSFDYDTHQIDNHIKAINSIRLSLSLKLGIHSKTDPLKEINSDPDNSQYWYAYIILNQLINVLVDYLQNHSKKS